MKHFFLFSITLFLASCGHRVMTMQTFYDIPNQTTSTELKSMAGAPFAIRSKEDNVVEYEYIERIKAGTRTIEERKYIFILKDNRVISRRVEQSTPPPFQINSYDLQTSDSSYESQTSAADEPVESED